MTASGRTDKVNCNVRLHRVDRGSQTLPAYYYPLDNSINIPAGILGGIFYSETLSKEEKLGHIGIMIGHEISTLPLTLRRHTTSRGTCATGGPRRITACSMPEPRSSKIITTASSNPSADIL